MNSRLSLSSESGRQRSRPWAVRVFGPIPGLKELNLLCWGLFTAFLVVPLCVLLWLQLRVGSAALLKLHPDFIYFYGIGQIVNRYPIVRIYDYGLQLSTFTALFALKDSTYGPSPYPAFVALFFSPFARISFACAYLIWAGVSLALYLTGIFFAVRVAFPDRRDRLKVSLIVCFLLASYPFIIGTLVNGQLSAIAFVSIGCAIFLESRSKPFCSGLALSILGYKPTLLLLFLPMLLLTRRFRAFFGLIFGGICLILVSTAIGGVEIWPVYIRFLTSFGQTVGLGHHASLQLEKYVDFHSVASSLLVGQSRTGQLILTAVTSGIALWLAVLLWKSAFRERRVQNLVWAATITWTLLLNVYAPIYDCVLVGIALILTLSAVKEVEKRALQARWVFLALVIFAVSWITVAFAKNHEIQLLTLLLTVLGFGQFYLLLRAFRIRASE